MEKIISFMEIACFLGDAKGKLPKLSDQIILPKLCDLAIKMDVACELLPNVNKKL